VVLVVTSEFTSLAQALSATRGVSLPTVVISRNPETVDEATALDLLDHAYQPIVDALVTPAGASPPAAPAPRSSRAAGAPVLDYEDEDVALAACHDHEWTDSLPVVPPTVPRVDAMLAAPGATGTMNVLTPRSDVSAMLTVLGDSLAYLGNPNEFIVHDGRVYPVAGPGQVFVIVAGGPEPTHATVIPSHPSCRPVTEPVPGQSSRSKHVRGLARHRLPVR
jgi:hypothetical protein